MAERLFFALWPDPAVRAEIQRLLEPLGLRGRVLAPTNWHITLAFLGSVAAEQRRRYEQAMEHVRGAPFELVLDRLGYFRRNRTLWLGAVTVPEALMRLHATVNSGLSAVGFEPDRRPFRAHLTLARRTPPRRLPAAPPLPWHVDRFWLVRSELNPAGARYHRQREFLLTG